MIIYAVLSGSFLPSFLTVFLLQGFILGGDKFFALGGYREKPTEDLGQSKEACYAWETGLIDK